MGRGRHLAAVKCPHHPHSYVVSFGFTSNRKRRRYRCAGPNGEHTFSVPITEPGEEVVVWSRPPACPKHPSSKVIRAGTTRGKAKAQRYKCFPNNGTTHTFTPPVARQHVHSGSDRCGLCERKRGVHQGKTLGGRYYRYGDEIIAGVLQRVGMGMTYTAASKWARRRATNKPTVSRDNGLAIGMVEAFSHVVWDPLSSSLSAAERDHRRQRRQGERLPPNVLIVDDVSFFNRSGTGFHCLVVADVVRGDGRDGAQQHQTRLRLVRALPANDTSAWAITLSEIGAPPDYLVADGASAISASLRVAFPDAEDDEVSYLPSIWHVKRNLHEAFFQKKSKTADRASGWDYGQFDELPGPVAIHLDQLGRRSGALASYEAFEEWWERLEELYTIWEVPHDVIEAQRSAHYDRVAAAVDALAHQPFLPASTGAVESLIRDRIKPFFHNRHHSFGNLERTNRALNLLVAHDRGNLDDVHAIARAVRADVAAHEGRAIGQRTMDDTYYRDQGGVIRYSSLRDSSLVDEIAKRRLLP